MLLGRDIGVIGTFTDLHSAILLSQVADSNFWAVTVVVPKGQSHRYKFIAGGRAMLDLINPQHFTRQDGSEWSGFFTDYCTDILMFERWETAILERLTNYILPFRAVEGQRFLNYYYNYLDKQTKETQYTNSYRLDQPVGVVNFIDKLLARQESHRLVDYKICLTQIDRVLRFRNPRFEPAKLADTDYEELYAEMAAEDGSKIPAWDYSAYSKSTFLPPASAAPHLYGSLLASQVRRKFGRGRVGVPREKSQRPEDRRSSHSPRHRRSPDIFRLATFS